MSATLIVIPVRAGSVGIPNKAMRKLGDQSPLYRTLVTAQQIGCDVVIATNDTTVQASMQNVGATVARLSEETARGDAPLDAAVCFATEYMERMAYPKTYQTVVTMQCTSPFTTADTVRTCIAIAESGVTALTVRDDRGLRWESAATDHVMLASRAPRRVVRQKMPPAWRETGAVFATPRRWLDPTSRFGDMVQLVPVSGKEAIDLDTAEDWVLAEYYAGVTERELLTAHVLTERPMPVLGAQAVILSAYREGVDEDRARIDAAAQWPDQVYLRGKHTHDEAQGGISGRTGNDLVIVTSAYHMPRAFLTFLRVLADQQLERTVRLWCAPVPSGFKKLSGEFAKITEYQAKGHCARYDEGLAYLQWRDSTQWSEAYACVA